MVRSKGNKALIPDRTTRLVRKDLLPNGMMEKEPRDALEGWKAVLADEPYFLIVILLCLCLVKAEVRCFER
jgi:hypothetical protein